MKLGNWNSELKIWGFTFGILNLESENLEFETSEFENLESENLEFENLEFEMSELRY